MTSGHEIRRGGVVGAIAGVDRRPGQRHGQHGLADTGRPDEQDVGGVLQEPQRGELVHQLFVHRRLGVEVEVLQTPHGRQRGERSGWPAGGSRSRSTSTPRSRSRTSVWPEFRLAWAWSSSPGSASAAAAEPQVSQMSTDLLIVRGLAHRLTSPAPRRRSTTARARRAQQACRFVQRLRPGGRLAFLVTRPTPW